MTNNVPAKAVVGDHEIEGDVANVTSLEDTTKQGGFDKDDGGRNLNKGPSDTKEPVDSLNTDFTDKTTPNDEQPFVPPVMKGKGVNTEAFVETLVQTLKTESEKVIDFSDMKAVLESSSDNAEFIESAFDIFKSTINSVVEDTVQKLAESAAKTVQDTLVQEHEVAQAEVNKLAEQMNAQYAEKVSQLEAELSDYVDAIVVEWAEDNKLAIQDTTRTAIAESFMGDLTKLLEAYAIDIPNEKLDLYNESVKTGEKLIIECAELKEENAQLKNNLLAMNKFIVTEGFITEHKLSMVDSDKLRRAAKTLEFINEDNFAEKLTIISEGYRLSNEVKKANLNESFNQNQTNLDDTFGQPDFSTEKSVNTPVIQENQQEQSAVDPVIAALSKALK